MLTTVANLEMFEAISRAMLLDGDGDRAQGDLAVSMGRANLVNQTIKTRGNPVVLLVVVVVGQEAFAKRRPHLDPLSLFQVR